MSFQADGVHVDASSEELASKPRRRRKRRFEDMRRIEGRLWPRQIRSLNSLRLDLQDQRTDEEVDNRERLTNNTLLRIAVAVLLDHKDALKGNTEDELLESLRKHLRDRGGETGKVDRSGESTDQEMGKSHGGVGDE